MSTGRIVGIVIGAILLLIILVIGGAYYWVKTSGPELRVQAQASANEGTEFGRSTDNQGCLHEALVKYDQCVASITCHAMANVFLLSCLDASVPVPGFCDGVPPPGSFMDSVSWRLEQCEEYGRGGSPCGNLFGQIEEYCGSPRAFEPGSN